MRDALPKPKWKVVATDGTRHKEVLSINITSGGIYHSQTIVGFDNHVSYHPLGVVNVHFEHYVRDEQNRKYRLGNYKMTPQEQPLEQVNFQPLAGYVIHSDLGRKRYFEYKPRASEKVIMIDVRG